jgi:myo-inositol-1(or 4)-monophosphatase
MRVAVYSVVVNLDPYRALMIEMAEKTGDFIRPFFANPDLAVELKADHSPVTAADRGAEEIMRKMIRAKFPNHGVLGEEFGADKTDAEFCWVLDPIDGTRAFASACPLFGTLIGLLHRGQPVLGAIHQPVLRQLMVGDGKTCTLDGRPVHTRRTVDLASATLLCSDWRTPSQYQDGARFDRLVGAAKLARTWGDCYGYLLLSSGWADLMCDPILNPWDIAALVPVVRGAGGVITDWSGGAPYPAKSLIAAATPELHAAALAVLQR